MTKLVVEVLDACDLMHKDRHGSASPFVEVVFDGQRQRTRTKAKDLNPVWNEKLVFNVSDPEDLQNKTTDIVVYNDQKDDHHKNFLGRVRLSGFYIPLSENEAAVQRYPLDKRGMFSNVRGDIALKIYAVHDSSYSSAPQSGGADSFENPLQEQHNKLDEDKISDKKKKKKEKEVRSFHSIGTATSAPAPKPTLSSGSGFEEKKENPVNVETRSDFAQAGQPTVMHMQVATQNSECELVETSPMIAARMRYKGGDKTSSTYDLVELMYYLYVNVVKARDLPTMDVTGSLDPYVEVKLGNYRGITRHFEKNQNPVWKQIFAFSKERLQSHLLEVTVKDKDIGKDDFVGRVLFDLSEVPLRVPPDSPLAPQWYKLVDKKGDKTKGELMLAVWIGTQADECFPEAWHSDAHDVNQENLSNTRSKVYFSPKLCYLRIHVIEAQDLVPYEKSHVPQARVKIQLGNQMQFTQPCASVRPVWNDELMFVASELDEFIIIKVEDRSKDQTLGTLTLPVSAATPRMESSKLVDCRWFNLEKPSSSTEASGGEKEAKFSSKIHLRLCLDAGYHVLDESTHYSSDLQPTAKHLRKPSIGILELGILNARNLLPMKTDAGRTDAYCVAKYGNKWVRSRTLLDTMAPRWNEQYTWQVHDPCTVITIGVFDNCHINGSKEGSKDQRIGKVRIRLSTLEANRVYTHYYPLLVLHPSGLKKTGELHLAVRFTCTAWVNMVSLYGKPMLPKMHYVQPIPVRYIELLRHHATQIVAARLARAEPPLRKETVEYMLDVHTHIWSARKSKANFNRMMLVFSGLMAVCKWFNDICYWKNPITTILVHVLFLILVCYPELILPTVFLYLFVIGIWNFRFRPRQPPHMDAKLSFAKFVPPDELDEEFDQFPSTRPPDVVRHRYDRLRSLAGRVQTVLGDLATQGERAHSLLSWRDPRATAIFIIFSLILAVVLYVTPIQVVAVLAGLYLLRHPRFRSKLPPVPVNFYKRLPAKSDMLL